MQKKDRLKEGHSIDDIFVEVGLAYKGSKVLIHGGYLLHIFILLLLVTHLTFEATLGLTISVLEHK
jgi:hypothetical protein